jgi:hypothetical protein
MIVVFRNMLRFLFIIILKCVWACKVCCPTIDLFPDCSKLTHLHPLICIIYHALKNFEGYELPTSRFKSILEGPFYNRNAFTNYNHGLRFNNRYSKHRSCPECRCICQHPLLVLELSWCVLSPLHSLLFLLLLKQKI